MAYLVVIRRQTSCVLVLEIKALAPALLTITSLTAGIGLAVSAIAQPAVPIKFVGLTADIPL
jgi:hypothetical protein